MRSTLNVERRDFNAELALLARARHIKIKLGKGSHVKIDNLSGRAIPNR